MIDLIPNTIYLILPNRPILKLNFSIDKPEDLISMEIDLNFYQLPSKDRTTNGKLHFVISYVEVIYGCILCYANSVK